MNDAIALLMPMEADAVLEKVNERLAVGGLSITRGDALMLMRRRLETLAELERVEFGTPSIVTVAEAVASSPCIAQENVAESLAKLQDAFYEVRDELSVRVSDVQIAQALRRCLDEWGDAADVASILPKEVLAYCDESVREQERAGSEYVISDDQGKAYVFDPSEWEYDECAPGWDGEGWADDWSD